MPLLQTRPNKHVSADAPPSRTVTQQPTRSQMLRLFHHSALHLFLFQPLIALLLHGGTPRFLLEPLLQDFLLALPQLLLIVPPGPLLPLQPVLLPRDCRDSRWGRGVFIEKIGYLYISGIPGRFMDSVEGITGSHTEQLLLLLPSFPRGFQPLVNVVAI